MDVLVPPPARYGSAMARRFGVLFHASGVGAGLARLRLEDHSVERIRRAADGAAVVYTLARTSSLDHLALNAALAARGLPLSVWAPGISTTPWLPLGQMWREWRDRIRHRLREGRAADPVASGWVARALATGRAITVFLERESESDALRALAAVPEDKPVHLVPVEIVWDRRPETSGLARFFLGSARQPWSLRKLWRLWRGADAFVHVGEPLDLGAIRERVAPDRLATVVRRVGIRSLRRETKLVRGPRLLPHRMMKQLVLDNPPMREVAASEARASGQSLERVRERMSREYDRLAASFSWAIIQALHVILRPLWTRVFSGVDVGARDMERIRAAMREGTPILVPCHKSHFDYLLLSWVFYDNDLTLPHVVAGMNLAVWPISVVLRGAGGFFIKRSFAGEALHAAVFSRYLRELVRQEYPVEFFIEGGRTRSGKLLPPRLGVLGMVMDAAAVRATGREVTLLPMAFAYEQVAEEGSYARELGGERKEPESVGQLLRARSVLRRRFGRAYLRVGEPLRCSELLEGWTGDRAEIQRVGERIVHRIGQVVVLLPTSLVALALLAHPARAIRHGELLERVARFDALLAHLGAERAASLGRFDQAIAQALDRFLREQRIDALEHHGERVWSIAAAERITLDFYKNQVLHFLAPALIAASALRGVADDDVPVDELLPAFERLSDLWAREFVLDPDRASDARLEAALDDLRAHGAIAVEGGRVRVLDVPRIAEIYALARPLLEAYALVLRASRPGHTRDGLARALQTERDDLLAQGLVTRPEALSLVTLKNAAARWTDLGALRADADGALTLDAEAAAGHREFMRRMVEP